MKKSIVAILAVAIIGALGVYSNSHKIKANTSVQSTNTSTSAKMVATNPSSTSQDTTSNSSDSTSGSRSSGTYKDGTYTGNNEQTAYGPVQIQVVVSGGRIVDVKFVTMPDELGHTQEVSNESAPLLKQSTLAKQSANIDFVSGATQTSEGYKLSLQSALDQAA
ncbi:FMN-binding protein [Candidatus Saccharibacteria bacterium]|nr:FMN-binding protein [Candidatus Saccharibacteria bacterium]